MPFSADRNRKEDIVKAATEVALKTGTTLAKIGMNRVIRKARYNAEDFSDQMILDIRKQPLKAMSITFGIAFGVGVAAGWFVKRA
jgi:hypothetical protein